MYETWEEDVDGIHIVAFAEETDPGEEGILGWIWDAGALVRRGDGVLIRE